MGQFSVEISLYAGSVLSGNQQTAHPGNRHSDFDKAIYNQIVGCMTNAGYAWLPEYKGCQDAPVATNSLCYLPSGAFARTVTRAQLAFE